MNRVISVMWFFWKMSWSSQQKVKDDEVVGNNQDGGATKM